MLSLLEHLRQACDAQHEALHRHPLLAPLNRGAIDLPRYKAILAMFHAAYAQPEAVKSATGLPDSPVLVWLAADMRHHAVTPLAWRPPALSLATESALVGYLYVKQGSTLGGQFISRYLAETLDVGPDRNHFFSGYGKETGAQWRAFRQGVQAIEARLTPREVIASAKASFEMIRLSADHVLQATL